METPRGRENWFGGTSPRMILLSASKTKKHQSQSVQWSCSVCSEWNSAFSACNQFLRLKLDALQSRDAIPFSFLEVLACVDLSGHSHKY